MGRFAGLANVRTNNSGIFYLAGNYLARLGTIKYLDDTRSGNDAFVVETTVVESDTAARAPGCRPSWVVTIKKAYLETCLGDIKAFAAAVLEIDNPDTYLAPIDTVDQITATQLGCTPQDAANNRFWEESIEALCSAEQPAKGMLIRLNCTARQTQSGNEFTKHVWGPVVHEVE